MPRSSKAGASSGERVRATTACPLASNLATSGRPTAPGPPATRIFICEPPETERWDLRIGRPQLNDFTRGVETNPLDDGIGPPEPRADSPMAVRFACEHLVEIGAAESDAIPGASVPLSESGDCIRQPAEPLHSW